MKPIFVFGSNEAGHHAGGAARDAVDRYGAVWGQAEGLQGAAYAIPTMSADFEPLKLSDINAGVERFLAFARENQQLDFHVTPIGTGIAGYSRSEIGPMFRGAPGNCYFFDRDWGNGIPERLEDRV